MARKRRKYSTPLVMTLAAIAPGCGGSAETATPDVQNRCGVDLACNPPPPDCKIDGSCPEVTETIPLCDVEEFPAYGTKDASCAQGDECRLVADCTSGLVRDFIFQCDASSAAEPRWAFPEDDACSNEFESCRPRELGGTFDCYSDWFYSGVGGNPPALCPDTLPAEGEGCYYGDGFGADRLACGYSCPDGGWTVAGCGVDETGASSWSSDGACSEGAGGAGGASGMGSVD